MNELDHYRDNLEHVVRPDDPSERASTRSVNLDDYEALYLRQLLIEFAAYGAEDATQEGIALAYAEYIDMVVRDERMQQVKLFAHTSDAEWVLLDALHLAGYSVDDLHGSVFDSVAELIEDE